MNCSDLKFDLSPYLDGLSSADESAAVEAHLGRCPNCRQAIDDLRMLRSGLRSLEPPVIPEPLVGSIREAVAARIAVGDSDYLFPFIPDWLADPRRIWLMSYSVGALASLVLGFSVLWMILLAGNVSHHAVANNYSSSRSSVLLANDNSSSDVAEPSSAAYAFARRDVSSESPSVNPNGTLIELTKVLVQGKIKDDEVVVVADVYSNGSAQIAEVVEPSHNRDAVFELAKALDTDPASAPFVPAVYDQRSDAVRVVFKIQTVYVRTQEKPRKRTAL
jgi:hypothetical protein